MARLPIRILQVLLPIIVVGGAGLVAYMMYLNRPPINTQPPVVSPSGVRVQTVKFETLDLTVTSQGTVQPRTTSQLVPEVSGPITRVAPSFVVGGFFEAGEVLLEIDPYDYQQSVIAARFQLAQARLRLAQEEAEAEVARREWEELGRGNPGTLTLRQPQVEEARAAIALAEAALERATRDLERAEIKAPYAGRVQSKSVDIGQFISRGTPVARIYAVDSAEIRLPVADAELAHINVPLAYRGTEQQAGPRVTLSTDFAGRRHTWQSRIVRTESEIDPISRMVHLVAEVRDPYAPGDDPARPPLAAGMFVEAEIEGRTVTNVVVLPWVALRGDNRVLIVDDTSRLRYRQVEVLRSTPEEVLVRSGLAEGELVSISPLDTVTDGMTVRVVGTDLRMVRNELPDTRPFTNPDANAIELDSVTQPQTNRPSLNFDIDPSLSRDEQIAAIRRQIEIVENTTPAVSSSGPTLDESAVTPPRVAEIGPGTSATRPEVTPRRPGPVESNTAGDRETQNKLARARTNRGRPENVITPASRPRADLNTAPVPAEPIPEPIARPTELVDSIRTVAILPFVNLSRNPVDDWIGTDMTTALRDTLGDTDIRNIVALTTNDESTALENARARDARWLIGGGYQRVGSQLRVTARVTTVRNGELARAIKVDGTVGELETLTSKMIAAVNGTLEGDATTPLATVERDATRNSDTTSQHSVAVLPFANITRKPADDPLADDIARTMVRGLQLFDGFSIVRLDESDETLASESASVRNIPWLVSGGYQHVGNQIRITVRLLNLVTGELVRTVKIDGVLDNLPDLVAEVISTLRSALDPRGARLVPLRPSRKLV